jgi:hypothetical protein
MINTGALTAQFGGDRGRDTMAASLDSALKRSRRRTNGIGPRR